MYATRGDLRQHVTKVHRCGIYAKMPAGGLSIRQRSYSSMKNSQRSSSASTSPSKQQLRRRETVYRCSICRSKFPHTRAIERHHYDVHHIDPFDTEAMKNATVVEEEEVEDEHDQQQQSASQQTSALGSQAQQDIHHRDEDEQMAIIQFRNQHQNADQSPLIVKIERGLCANESRRDQSFIGDVLADGYDDFETADDYLLNKPTPRARQWQRARRAASKNAYDEGGYLDGSMTKRDYLHHSNYDMKDQYDADMDYDNENEGETADTFVESIDDDDNFDDDLKHSVIKYRSSTQKLT